MSKDFTYLDSNSTAEISQEVSGIILDIIISNCYGNASSSHASGNKIKAILEASRYSVAEFLGAAQNEIIFTSGGTEANNLALRGVYNIYADSENEVAISAAEHSSVFNTVEAIVPHDKLRLIPLLPDGSLDLEWAERLITEDTSLVSVMLANNETGVIFPVEEIVKLAHSRGALVHCDAVQAFGKMPIDVKALGVDLLSISGHKAHALPGVGALYIRKGIQLHPIFSGGKQESGIRPGTENYIGIASMGAVAGEYIRYGLNNSPGLRDAFEKSLVRRISDIIINGKDSPRIFNTSSITFKNIHAAAMVEALSENGVYVSAGSACSTGILRPSRTLKSMSLSDEEALSTVRFSFSKYSTPSDAAIAIDKCVEVASILRE